MLSCFCVATLLLIQVAIHEAKHSIRPTDTRTPRRPVLSPSLSCSPLPSSPYYPSSFSDHPPSCHLSRIPTTDPTSCSVLIKPSNTADHLQLTFSLLDMNGAGFTMYDGQAVGTESLWTCISCSTILPPPLRAESGAAYIVMENPDAGGSYIQIQFVGVTASLTDTQTVEYHMPIGNIFAPAVGSSSNDNRGIIPRGLDFRWQITPSDAAASDIVTLMVANLDFDASTGDHVVIYDGSEVTDPVLVELSGTSADLSQWVESSQNAMLVRLLTDAGSDAVTGRFGATYLSKGAGAAFGGGTSSCGFRDQPAVMRGATMMFTDGSAADAAMNRVEECEWLVQPEVLSDALGEENKLIMVASAVSMKPGSQIAVYDGDSDNGVLLWDCVNCKMVVPPILVSTSGSFFVAYESNSFIESYTQTNGQTAVYMGFEARFFSNWIGGKGMGDGGVILGMGTAISVTAPTYMGVYPEGIDHRWVIKPQAAVANTHVYLTFNELDFAASSGDGLSVYEGEVGPGTYEDANLLGYFTGSVLPTEWIRVPSSSALTLRMHTDEDGAHAGTGFDVAFYADSNRYQCGHSVNPGVLRAPSFFIADGSSSAEPIYPGMDCEWLVKPNVNGTAVESINLAFSRMSLEGGELYVFAGEGSSAELVWSCVGCTAVPGLIRVEAKAVRLYYTTENSAYEGSFGNGFEMKYFSTYVSGRGTGDHQVELRAGSALDIRSTAVAGELSRDMDMAWLIDTGATITLAWIRTSFEDGSCGDNVTIYDGSNVQSPVLYTTCGSAAPVDWLVSSATTMLIVLRTNGDDKVAGDFKFSYFSDTNKDRCGHYHNPGLLDAWAMRFSDGSSSAESVRSNQRCEWLIAPLHTQNIDEVVLQFTRIDIIGGNITVYRGQNANGLLLWNCHDCSEVPPSLTSNESMYVTYETDAAASGHGFEAQYFTVEDTSTATVVAEDDPMFSWASDGNNVLRMPSGSQHALELRSSVAGTWNLEATTSSTQNRLLFGPALTDRCSSLQIRDGYGRNAPKAMLADLSFPPPTVCGSYTATSRAVLKSYQSVYMERGGSPRSYYSDAETGQQCRRIRNITTVRPELNQSVHETGERCQWLVDGDEVGASTASVRFNSLALAPSSELKVFAGTSGNGELLFSCRACQLSQKTITSDCGSIFMVHVYNSTNATETFDGNANSSQPGFAAPNTTYSANFDAHVWYTKGKGQRLCIDDPLWAPKVKEKEEGLTDLLVITLVLSGAIFFVGLAIPIYIFWMKRYRTDEDPLQSPANSKLAAQVISHPKYTPMLDNIRNLLLKEHECCICYTTEKSFMFECAHAVCKECLHSYLTTALGDVAMFPLKCPMHHQGCTHVIGPETAKRLLTREEYNRFNDFNDRALFGEGMHCLKCSFFVNLPANAANPMVQCPYCRFRFCYRCKTAWHTGLRCEERPDNELEEWRKSRGAQRCPGCYKIIEKDDPEVRHARKCLIVLFQSFIL